MKPPHCSSAWHFHQTHHHSCLHHVAPWDPLPVNWPRPPDALLLTCTRYVASHDAISALEMKGFANEVFGVSRVFWSGVLGWLLGQPCSVPIHLRSSVSPSAEGIERILSAEKHRRPQQGLKPVNSRTETFHVCWCPSPDEVHLGSLKGKGCLPH